MTGVALAASFAGATLATGHLGISLHDAQAEEPPAADSPSEAPPATVTTTPPASLPAASQPPVPVALPVENAPAAEPRKTENPDRHETGQPPPPSETGDGFSFGSYGRASIGIDGRGHEGYDVSIVSHGSRLEESPYLELDLYYGGRVGESGRWRVVLAPAFAGDLFHYSGNFSSHFALRNAYAEVEGLGLKGLSLWAGSRMLRGDDVYLFDYWPLDNLNTVGGGANLRLGPVELQLHGGLNRLDTGFQYETIDTPPRSLGAPGQAVVLDRPRSVGSFKATYRLGPARAEWGAKLSVYGELHYLPDGQFVYVTQNRTEKLSAETGWVVGAQLGGWLRPYTFANLFFRAAGGLAAYGELSPPTGLGPDKTSANAREYVVALSANYETRWLGVMLGAYARSFADAGPAAANPASYVEGIAAVRPQVYLSKYFHVAAEASYQRRSYDGFDASLNRRLEPEAWRLSLLPLVSPLGRGTYMRPIVYLNATVSFLNDDAVAVKFDPQDVRAQAKTVYYLGIGAEWWFQSSYR